MYPTTWQSCRSRQTQAPTAASGAYTSSFPALITIISTNPGQRGCVSLLQEHSHPGNDGILKDEVLKLIN